MQGTNYVNKLLSVIKFILKFLIKCIFIVIFIIILLICIGLFFFPINQIAENIIKIGFNIYGRTLININITNITTTQFIAENVDLGDPNHFHIKKIKFDYSIDALRNQIIEQLTIDGLMLNGNKQDKNKPIVFGNLDKYITKRPKFSAFKFIIKKAVVNAFTFAVSDSDKSVVLPFNLVIDKDKYEFTVSQAVVNIINFEIRNVGNISLVSKLFGNIPLNWDGKNMSMIKGRSGEIGSIGIGEIKFIPKTPPSDENRKQLYNLFSDFKYDKFDATLNISGQEQLKLSIAFEGSNASFYNGRVIKLNLNLTVAMSDLLDSINFINSLRNSSYEEPQ